MQWNTLKFKIQNESSLCDFLIEWLSQTKWIRMLS